MIHSTGSLFYSDASARALPGRMHFYMLPVYSSNGQAKPAHFKIFAPQKYLYAACAAARPCRADNPAGNSPQHNISPHPRRRKVRFAPLPPFRGKLRPLPCSSFSRRDRSAGSRWEFYTAPYWTIPLGIPPNITFPPIHSNGEWGAYSLIGLSNGRVPRTFIDSVRCWGKTRTQGVTNP